MTQLCYLLLSLYTSDPTNPSVYKPDEIEESCSRYVGIVKNIYTNFDGWYHPKKKKPAPVEPKECPACTCVCPQTKVVIKDILETTQPVNSTPLAGADGTDLPK